MSDDRDPDRNEGSQPDEPRGEVPVSEGAPDAGVAEAADPATPATPYGPPEPDAFPAPDALPAPPRPPAGYDPAGLSAPADAPGPDYAPHGSGSDYAPHGSGPGHAPLGSGPGHAPGGHAPGGYAPPSAAGQSPRPRGGKGLAIASLVVGIATVVGALIPFLNFVMFVPAVVAVVLGVVSLARRMDGKPLAVTGIVLGAVGFVLSVVLALAYTLLAVGTVSDAVASADTDSGYASPEPTDGLGDGDATARAGTSPDDPLPIGTPVTGAGVDGPEWEITLGTPVLDATAAVLAAEEGNPPPAEGMQYAVVPVMATYLGSTEGDPLSELVVGFLAADGSQYSAADSFALAPAPAFTENEELLAPQGTASGNVVVEIPIEGAEDGLWATVPGLTADAYFFRAG